jgi:menaquinone-9 beta-reductase
MTTCDVLIAGGGPAGSSCAWKLREAGLDVIVVDRAVFPRDKVCAGWITPQVIDELRLDVEGYRQGRTFQPFSAFRTGLLGSDRIVETTYEGTVSFGIRRCEFDDYLLRRSGARLMLGTPVSRIRRDRGQWIVNDMIRAAALVGAGGHFCPVARWLNGPDPRAAAPSLVVARELEVPIGSAWPLCTVAETTPELYFSRDLKGYGWCIRKEQHVNIGFGGLDNCPVRQTTDEFVDFLQKAGIVRGALVGRWRGHAYLVNHGRRRICDDGVILIGDSAGLAYPQSGEGIRPAIESGFLAAGTLVHAQYRYTRPRLEPYAQRLRARYDAGPLARALHWGVPSAVSTRLASALLARPGFVRHVVLNRWFLHRGVPALGNRELGS